MTVWAKVVLLLETEEVLYCGYNETNDELPGITHTLLTGSVARYRDPYSS